jgi:hypothetical protein
LKTSSLDSTLIYDESQLYGQRTDLNTGKDKAKNLWNMASTSTPLLTTISQSSPPNAKPIIRRLVLWVSAIIGLGFILPNAAVVSMLVYVLSTFTIASQGIVIQMSGTILFLLASILLIVLGIVIVNWGIRYYTHSSCTETVFIGVILGSFYLLCLGMGSALLAPKIGPGELLLVISPVLIMVSVALNAVPSFRYRTVAALLGIASGVLLATALYYVQPLKLAFMNWNTGWDNIVFLGPFMSFALSEGMVVIVASIAASVHLLSAGQKAKPASYALFSIIGLIYGISLFIGAFTLSFSLLNIVWETWLPPLSGLPTWIFQVVIFWSASLIILEIGGLALIALSSLGLVSAAKEFSQLYQT